MARVVILALAAAVVAVPDGRASLHHPQEPMAIPVEAKGVPQPLPFLEFKRRLLVLRNASNLKMPLEAADPKNPGKTVKSDRGVVDERVKKARAKGAKLTESERVALAVDLLHSGQSVEAETALVGMRGFLADVTRAHIAAARGEWARAFEYLDIANGERPPPAADLGLSQQQLAWQVKLNNGPLLKLVQSRWKESQGSKSAPEDETPDRIFDVNFVNAAGAYEPGVLAPAEAAKLPPDALATVQQLVLWFPTDPRLYWLLGELYAVRGDFAAAKKIMDECVDSLQYSNRKVLMQHREAVTRADKEKGSVAPADEPLLGPEKPPEPTPHVAFTMRAVWVYIGVVAAVAALVLVRSVLKRRRRVVSGQ